MMFGALIIEAISIQWDTVRYKDVSITKNIGILVLMTYKNTILRL